MSETKVVELKTTRRRIEAVDADLSSSSFHDVNLSGAIFDDVNLSNVTIRNACLSGLDISDANLKGAKINGILLTDLMAAYRAAQAAKK